MFCLRKSYIVSRISYSIVEGKRFSSVIQPSGMERSAYESPVCLRHVSKVLAISIEEHIFVALRLLSLIIRIAMMVGKIADNLRVNIIFDYL